MGRVERGMEKAREATGNANSNGGAGKAKVPLGRRFRCKAAGHYSDNCTVKLCERCGGRRHEISKCASPADMDESPAEAVLAMVEDPGDNAVETTSF